MTIISSALPSVRCAASSGRHTPWIAACVVLGLVFAMGLSSARARGKATFALVIGVNKDVDRRLRPLRYADDDAARYFALFRLLGAKVFLLSGMDRNTRRLHPQAAGEALAPTRAVLARVVQKLKVALQRARRRGLEVVLYVAYAGHGNVHKGQGYVSLADGRLTGLQLSRWLARSGPLGADRVHLIVDACYAYYLAFGRGPGGKSRTVRGFSRLATFVDRKRVGLLLSTSSARRTHEWQAFQAGVFSHEVRSGLYGAADVNRDGRVTYREMAAFIQRANAAIPNPRFRPQVFARPPGRSTTLVETRKVRRHRIVVGGRQAGRYQLEDDNGVRLVDFHSKAGQALHLLRPVRRRLFLRHLGSRREYQIPPGEGTVNVAHLQPTQYTAQLRGAAHRAFQNLFKLPFSQETVRHYRFPPLPPVPGELLVDRRPPNPLRRAGWALLGTAAALVVGGATLSFAGLGLRETTAQDASHETVVRRNQTIKQLNGSAIALYVGAGAAAVMATVFLLLHRKTQPTRRVSISPFGAGLSLRLSFQ